MFHKNKILKPFFFIIALSFSSILNAQKFNWVQKFGGSGTDIVWNLATDQNDNYYVLGEFSSILPLDSVGLSRNLNSVGGRDVFLAKYNCNKVLQWRLKIGGTSDDGGEFPFMGIKIAASGNIYISGSFSGNASFYDANQNLTHSLTAAGGTDVFLAKVNNKGMIGWVAAIGGPLNDENSTLEIDASENIYAAGFFTGTASFNSMSGAPSLNKSSLGSSDLFVAKYNSFGTIQNVATAGGTAQDVANNLCLDELGNLYVVGNFACCLGGTAQFGSITISNTSGWGAYIAKLSSIGTWVWVNHIGGGGQDGFSKVFVDKTSQAVYAVGHINANATLASQPPGADYDVVVNGGFDIVATKLSYNGSIIWAKSFGSTSNDYGYAVALDKNSNLLIGGSYGNTMTFGSTTLNLSGTESAYLATLNAINGNPISAERLVGSAGNVVIIGLDVSASNTLFASGYFTSNIQLTSGNIPVSGPLDGFVAMFQANDSIRLSANKPGLSCQDSVLLTANSFGANQFLWFRNDTFIKQTDSSFLFAKLAGAYKVVGFKNCLGYDTSNQIILGTTAFNISAGDDLNLCQGDTATIFASGASEYFWYPRSHINDTSSATPKVWPNVNTMYYVIGKAGDCEALDSIEVNILSKPIVEAGKDSILCKGQSLQLQGTVSNATGFSWRFDPSLNDTKVLEPFIKPKVSTYYVLTAQNSICQTQDSIHIQIYPEVIASFKANPSVGFKPLTVNFENKSNLNAKQFNWDFGEANMDTTKNPTYIYYNAGRFLVKLIALDSYGCADSASQELTVNEEEFLFVPNVFTPQGNGLNEVFEAVYTKSQFDFLELLVYSRWGELLHKTQMPGGVWWNGTYKDSPCPEGVYFYVLKAKSSTGKLYDLNGTITLKR